MKKLLTIPATILAASCFFLASCGNLSTDNGMKSPEHHKADTTIQKTNKKVSEKDGKEKKEKKDKKNKKISFFQPTRIFNEANTNAIYKTQADLWL